MSETPLIIIMSFEPLRLELPESRLKLSCQVRVRLPPVRVKLIDLSLGGLVLDAPTISADLPMTELTISFKEPITLGDLIDIILANADAWQALWRASQEALDKCGPILG